MGQKPRVCIPVIATTGMQVMEDIMNLQELDIQVIELRIDFYEHVLDLHKVNDLLNSIFNINKIEILFTYRSKNEGGNILLEDTYLKELIELVSQHPVVEYVDIENSCTCRDELIKIVHESNKKVILSNHDFNKTPDLYELLELLGAMANTPADILKVAYMPVDKLDVLTVMQATLLMKGCAKPIISMSMGPLGAISRLVGEFTDNYLTFAMNSEASAPGQIYIDDVNRALEIINHAMKTD